MHDIIDTLINGPSRWGAEHHLSTGWLAIFAITVLLAELVLLYVLIWGIFTFFQNTPSMFRLLLQKCGVGKKDVPQAFRLCDRTTAYFTAWLSQILRLLGSAGST